MIPGLEQTPAYIAWMLGFFMALALRRNRIKAIIDGLMPGKPEQ